MTTQPTTKIIEVNRTKNGYKQRKKKITTGERQGGGVNSIVTAARASLGQHTINNRIATAHCSENSCHRTRATTKKRKQK
jgi:hypothetical protein